MVEPVLRAWELDAALKNEPGVLRFVYLRPEMVDVYLRPEMVDRNPPPGVVTPHTGRISVTGWPPTVRVGRGEYPAPPSGLAIGSEVTAMFDKWSRYKAGQGELADTANFCLTALEGKEKEKDKRKKAAAKFRISRKRVLDPLGQLAERGRKYKGYDLPYTETERAWLEVVLKKLIRRAAEVAHDPNAPRPLISMGDLPPL